MPRTMSRSANGKRDAARAWLGKAKRIKADYKRISLADCFCAALAKRVEGSVVTADQEFKPLADAAGCSVEFIR